MQLLGKLTPPADWHARLLKEKEEKAKNGEYVPRRTIVFTASVVQAETCCNVFNRAFPGLAEWVCGKTNQKDRAETLLNFQTSKTALVANCGVLTEGFDNPGVEVIIMARPTMSRALYAQMIGRATRPQPGVVDGLATSKERKDAIEASPKKRCRVCDFVGNTGEHRLVTAFDVLGGKVSDDIKQRAILDSLEKGRPVNISVELTKAEQALEKERHERAEAQRRDQEERKKHLLFSSKYSYHEMDAFDHAYQGAEQEFHHNGYEKPITQKQINFLRRRGWPPHKLKISCGKARVIIGLMAQKEGWNKTKGTT